MKNLSKKVFGIFCASMLMMSMANSSNNSIKDPDPHKCLVKADISVAIISWGIQDTFGVTLNDQQEHNVWQTSFDECMNG